MGNKKWINAGKYRHQITIRQEMPTTRNTFGERVGMGATVWAGWAEKQDWSGRELSEAQRETAEVLTKFLIRWRADILPQMVVLCNEEIYNIQSVLDFDGTRRELVLNCQRVQV